MADQFDMHDCHHWQVMQLALLQTFRNTHPGWPTATPPDLPSAMLHCHHQPLACRQTCCSAWRPCANTATRWWPTTRQSQPTCCLPSPQLWAAPGSLETAASCASSCCAMSSCTSCWKLSCTVSLSRARQLVQVTENLYGNDVLSWDQTVVPFCVSCWKPTDLHCVPQQRAR